MVIFTNFFISSNIYKSGNSCWREQNSLPLLHFFITWFCTADRIRKSEGEEDTNQKVQVMSNLTASQFRSMLPRSMAEMPSSLHHLSTAVVFGEGRFTSQKGAPVHSARCTNWKPWEPGLRTKPLRPLARNRPYRVHNCVLWRVLGKL